MSTPRILDEIGARLSELAANSPVRDIEKNAKAMLGSAFGKLDLVTREEFEVQREVLAQARRKLAELEARVAPAAGRARPRGRAVRRRPRLRGPARVRVRGGCAR